MLAWRFILLWLTVILTVSPLRCTVSVSILVCFSSVSHYAYLFHSFCHTPHSPFSLYVSICFCISFNPSLFCLSSLIALLFLVLLLPPLPFHFTAVNIYASLCFIPPPFPLASSPTPSHSWMKVCKHVFHMQTHCPEPTEQTDHA